MRGANFGATLDKDVQVDNRSASHFGQYTASASMLWNDTSDNTVHDGVGYLRAQNSEHSDDKRGSALPSKVILVLGLTEEVERDDLILYFGKYGVIENCVIKKDSLDLESPGRAYVTFANIEDASSVVSTAQHYIYGKPCLVRYCSLQDVQPSSGTNRIFVARIPSSVTQPEFRAYFGAFGTIKDAYMPKDSSKIGHRGIGFITYAHSSSVENVMMCKHALGGNELAIDRANPKEKPSAIGPSRLASSQPNLAMAGSWNNNIDISHHHTTSPAESAFSTPQGSLADAFLSRSGHSLASLGSSAPYFSGRNQNMMRSNSNTGLPLPNVASNPYLMAGFANSPTAQSVTNLMDPLSPAGASYMSSHSSSLNESLMSGRFDASYHGSRGESPWLQGGSGHGMNGPQSARAGPRIFVGKLARETTEMDLKNYFSQFGFVLDVYLPRDKTNKQEHRGFGFVTFETDAAIHRIQGLGNHTILGANIAIESAVPRAPVEETRVEQDTSGQAGQGADQLNSGFEAFGLDSAR